MRALTIVPGEQGSLKLEEVDEPTPGDGELLVDAMALGVCGTDRELSDGEYGWAPPGADRLIIGHESLGRVREAPEGGGFAPGDLVVGVVRRPDPEPCCACARGLFDNCRNGEYTERGIKEIHGYGSEVWTVEADYAVKLDPSLADVGVLLEPMSVLVKAWEQIDKVGSRSWFDPKSVLVTGAGPIGLLAALIGAQRGLDVHVLDRAADGHKPKLVEALGATYHHEGFPAVMKQVVPDVVIEATGSEALVFDAMAATGAFGVTCLTGVSPAGRRMNVDAGSLNRDIVLENDVVVGSVNANLDHCRKAAEVLADSDREWLRGLITRRVSLDDFTDAFHAGSAEVKVVIDIG
ncbi:glucose 1-dehydrogenase [Glycomyces harbinensis]|uniref:Threonine dehydrogenase n=1 Tax=Glycomyces harbinensis TaxID=58114 RepID=A0A1G6QWK7_9ACTN|nr:glucose 1-dehydrogenase [Glycomyces harbinensis]SDC96688.1 Threonine dehydrogenase [Glycomyces harbinensis]